MTHHVIFDSVISEDTTVDLNSFDMTFSGDAGSFIYGANIDVELVKVGGLILTAPDAGRWRVSVDNAGALSTASA